MFTYTSSSGIYANNPKTMSGMTGYDQAASYSTSQYSYVPNLPSATGGNGLNGQTGGGGVATGDPNGSLGDPRQLHQWHHGGYHQPSHGMQMPQGSPTSQRYPSYYDRNGYYNVHQQSLDSQQSWHEPVVPGSGALNTGGTTTPRPDSPSSIGMQQTGYASPAVTNPVNNTSYSCKMAAQQAAASLAVSGSLTGPGGPPSPNTPQGQPKGNDNPQQQHQATVGQQYPQYQQCPLSQSSQPIYNNNIPPPPPGSVVGPGGPGVPGGPHQPVHNSYSLSPDGHVGQPSPGSMGQGTPGGGPPNGPQGPGAPQAPLPSPLYPWMRSQFGKTLNISTNFDATNSRIRLKSF